MRKKQWITLQKEMLVHQQKLKRAGAADASGQPKIRLAITGAGLSAQNMCEKISNSSNTIQDFKTQGLNKIYTTTNQLRQTRDQ